MVAALSRTVSGNSACQTVHGRSKMRPFLGDEMYQNSCCFALIQTGENVKRLPMEIMIEHPDV